MQKLREMLNKMNYKNVKTYIQSGNIILDTNEEEKKTLENKIKEAIKNQFGYDVPVLVKTIQDVKKTIKENPYPISDEKVVAVVFLSDVSPSIKTIKIDKAENDEFTISNDVIYLYCPNGFGRSKLTVNVFEKKLGLTATSRNWKTTNKLLELANTK